MSALEQVYFSWYHLDLDLPRTGICEFDEAIPLPMDLMSNDTSLGKQVQFQGMAMISIHRIVTRIHTEMFQGTYTPSYD